MTDPISEVAPDSPRTADDDYDSCWFCSGEACAICLGLRHCEHDVTDRHGDNECTWREA